MNKKRIYSTLALLTWSLPLFAGATSSIEEPVLGESFSTKADSALQAGMKPIPETVKSTSQMMSVSDIKPAQEITKADSASVDVKPTVEAAKPADAKAAPTVENKTSVEVAKQTDSKTAAVVDAKVAEAAKLEEAKRHWKTFGRMIAWNMGLPHLIVTPEAYQAFIEGVEDAIRRRVPVPKLSEQEQAALQKFIGKVEQESIEQNQKAGEAFLKLKEKETGFKKLPSGVVVQIIQPGTGAHPTDDCSVKVKYEGKLLSGEVFDSTSERGEDQATFYLGMIISGLREVIQLLGKGGEARAYIPCTSAYGNESVGSIPGGSTLDFWVKLLEFTNPAVPAASPAPAKADAPATIKAVGAQESQAITAEDEAEDLRKATETARPASINQEIKVF